MFPVYLKPSALYKMLMASKMTNISRVGLVLSRTVGSPAAVCIQFSGGRLTI